MLMFAAVALTVGVIRNGILAWYSVFAKPVPPAGPTFIMAHWGLLLCLFGIVGGFAGGLVPTNASSRAAGRRQRCSAESCSS